MVVVFGVFIVLLLFAGWYLDPESVDPARLYLNFVLTATSYLVLLLALFLSSQSLPADIKNHTIYTVVTKPVRASEVVLGRILGFTAVTTLLLVVIGLISYVFVQRNLAHTHQLTAADLEPIKGGVGGTSAGLQGRTSRVHGHRHTVTISPSGKGRVEMEQRHWHSLTIHKDGNETTYELGPVEGLLVARVPVYGKLRFLDRDGQQAERGINVGDEWTYRSFIPGGSLARAIWTFDGVTPERFPKGLPIEMTLEVFRTYKGDIEKGIRGTLKIRNPKTGVASAELPFVAKKYDVDVHLIPRKLQTREGKPLDLFQDLVNNGRVEVWLKCAESAQNFGAAQGDMYLRAGDAPFWWNFVKGYFCIWLQSLMVIAIGVMFSTFLSGPVALLATAGVLTGGFFLDFMYRLSTQQTYGGGPFESLRRLVTQENMTSQLEPGLQTTVVRVLDQVAEVGLWVLSRVLPDFKGFNFSDRVASGFNIPGDLALIYTCRTLAFLLPVFVVAYLCLKNREVAK